MIKFKSQATIVVPKGMIMLDAQDEILLWPKKCSALAITSKIGRTIID